MEIDNPIIYGLEFQTRALTAQTAETDITRFLVGTQSINQSSNQIHLVELNEKNDSVKTKIFHHKFGEIWKLTSSPFDSNILATCYNTIKNSIEPSDQICEMKTSFFRLNNEDNNSDQLEKLVDFETNGAEIKTNEFNGEDRNKCAIVTENCIQFFDVGNGESSETLRINLEGKNNPKYSNGKWYPHQNSTQFIAINDSNLLSYDTRTNETNKPVWRIESNSTNQHLLKDFDVNINKQALIATGGDDCFIKLWDTRKPNEPLYARRDHSHWIWCIRFNIYHDQLLLTSSSDFKVLLTNVHSFSSEFGKNSSEDLKEQKQEIEDGPLQWYEHHEDSVYCVEWSTADPWTFASLSYDGRLVINKVPKQYKYQIIF